MAVTTASPTTSRNSEIKKYVEDLNTMDYALLNNDDKSLSETDGRINLENDISEENKNYELLHIAKREFYSGRKVWIKQLPQHTNEEDIRELLGVVMKHCEIDTSTSTALVTLEHAEDCEIIMEKGTTQKLKDNDVTLSLTINENFLCVAHLPFIYTEEDFMKLVQSYGPVSRCFLMRSDTTGQSKGYGFVEFTTKDVANNARVLLEGKKLGTCILQCDWLQPSHTTYSSLHSKCLFVDHLPPDYRDMGEFRNVFNVLVEPSYCQIAMKNNNPVGFGLVDFDVPSQAEETQILSNGHQIGNYKIRVTYCIPGVAVMAVYTKLTAVMNLGARQGLLPAPNMNLNVLNNLQMLAMQNNPQMFQALSLLNKTYSGNRNNAAKSGLLGNAPASPFSMNNNQATVAALMASQMQIPPLTSQSQSQKPSLLGNPLMTSNLLAVQKALSEAQKIQTMNSPNQSQTGMNKSPGISKSGLLPHPTENNRSLSNQQLNIQGRGSMQNLSQGTPNFLQSESASQTRGGSQGPSSISETNLQALLNLFSAGMGAASSSASNIHSNGTSLQNNSAGVNFSFLNNLPEQNPAQKGPSLNQPIASHLQHLQGLANPLLSFLLSNQYQTQQIGNSNNIQKPSLLGNPNRVSSGNDAPLSPTSKFASYGEITPNFANQNPFLFDKPNTFSTTQKTPLLNNPATLMNQKMPNFPNQKPSLLGEFPPNIPEKRPSMQFSPSNRDKISFIGNRSPIPRKGLLGDGPHRQLYEEDVENEPSSGREGIMPYSDNSQPFDPYIQKSQYAPSDQCSNENISDSLIMGAVSTFLSMGMSLEQAQQAVIEYVKSMVQTDVTSGLSEAMNAVNLLELYQHYLQQWTNVCKTGKISDLLTASLSINKCLEVKNQGMNTPMGQKRAISHILPSPEPSPEGSYVGQHSQGIGGHYADSYIKRRRL